MIIAINLLPQPDEIEISVFGPGYGESIVIHVGKGNWFVVDCCMDKSTQTPKPILYLESLGVNPAEKVKFIAATHWHDDHVAGLSKMLEICSSAVFCCPVSLTSREFLALSELYKDAPVGQKPGTEELRRSIEIATKRSHVEKKHMLKFSHADKKIHQIDDLKVSVFGLSPSDEMIRRCNDFMLSSYAAATSQTTVLQRLIVKSPNDTAAVLRLNIKNRAILLGSDIEEHGDPLVGWSSIVASHDSESGIYHSYKVAHHGSKSGHHDDVWSKLLTKNPLSMITPFRLGRHKLPNSADRARIMSLTDQAYITANPDRETPPKGKRASKVEALIASAAQHRRSVIDTVGHIRWRAMIDDEKDPGLIELFDGALPLSKVA